MEPIKFLCLLDGGLGIRNVALLPPSDYLGYAASTKEGTHCCIAAFSSERVNGQQRDINHGLSCRRSTGCHSLHNQVVNDTFCRASVNLPLESRTRSVFATTKGKMELRKLNNEQAVV